MYGTGLSDRCRTHWACLCENRIVRHECEVPGSGNDPQEVRREAALMDFRIILIGRIQWEGGGV